MYNDYFFLACHLLYSLSALYDFCLDLSLSLLRETTILPVAGLAANAAGQSRPSAFSQHPILGPGNSSWSLEPCLALQLNLES